MFVRLFKQKHYNGFTLIELLVVIAIIAILAAIAIPQYAKHRQRVYNSVAHSDLRNLQIVLEAYYAENLKYPTIQ